ncbi:hypothetical protein OIO90_005244 [Microbotryomycetes sp. JL221]|nr:hypothetical protein OIO90_005244 [Microbotryomycetes sp. JL221]
MNELRKLVAEHKAEALARLQFTLAQRANVKHEATDPDADNAQFRAREGIHETSQPDLQSTPRPQRDTAGYAHLSLSSPSKLKRIFEAASPTKRAGLYLSGDARINEIELPPFFDKQAFGARTLRRRIEWILQMAQSLHTTGSEQRGPTTSLDESMQSCAIARYERELVRKIQRSSEWWRVNKACLEQERVLGCGNESSFAKFKFDSNHDGSRDDEPTTALWRAYLDHYRLCGNGDEHCQFHLALALHHSNRPSKGRMAHVQFPTSFDIQRDEVRDQWLKFAQAQMDLKKHLGWSSPFGGRARLTGRGKRKRK